MQEMNRYKKKTEACIKFSFSNLLFAETISFFPLFLIYYQKQRDTLSRHSLHLFVHLAVFVQARNTECGFSKKRARWTRWANRWMIRLLVLLASLYLKVWWTMSWRCAQTSILRMWPKIWSSREVQQGQSTEFWMARSVKHLFLNQLLSSVNLNQCKQDPRESCRNSKA